MATDNTTMTAVRYHGPRDLRCEQVPRPGSPDSDQVRVQVKAAGICGSDLHVYETGDYITRFPVTMGHEFAGVVAEIGSDVEHLQVGDHVVGDSRVFCGQCVHCRQGQYNLCLNLGFVGEVCEGAYTREIIRPATDLYPISSRVPHALAALAEPLAVALHAVKRARLNDSQQRVLILGAGPIGALIHRVLTLENGDRRLHIVDRSSYRQEQIGAIDPMAVVETPQGPYDLVFETTGSNLLLATEMSGLVCGRGRLILVGLFKQPAAFNFTSIVEGEWTVKGCSVFSDEMPEAVRMLEQHWPLFEHIVSHRMALENCQKAFDALLSPTKEAMKIVLTPND